MFFKAAEAMYLPERPWVLNSCRSCFYLSNAACTVCFFILPPSNTVHVRVAMVIADFG